MSIFNRCKHQWVETHRDVQRRAGRVKFGGGFLPDQFDDLIYGCTHIELCCSECGDVTHRKIRGEHPDD